MGQTKNIPKRKHILFPLSIFLFLVISPHHSITSPSILSKYRDPPLMGHRVLYIFLSMCFFQLPLPSQPPICTKVLHRARDIALWRRLGLACTRAWVSPPLTKHKVQEWARNLKLSGQDAVIFYLASSWPLDPSDTLQSQWPSRSENPVISYSLEWCWFQIALQLGHPHFSHWPRRSVCLSNPTDLAFFRLFCPRSLSWLVVPMCKKLLTAPSFTIPLPLLHNPIHPFTCYSTASPLTRLFSPCPLTN